MPLSEGQLADYLIRGDSRRVAAELFGQGHADAHAAMSDTTGAIDVNDLSQMSGEDATNDRVAVYQSGNYKRLTASGAVKTSPGVLVGFYVGSTTGGTITLYDQVNAGAPQISGTITPTVGFHRFPAVFSTALWAALGGTIDVTFFYV